RAHARGDRQHAGCDPRADPAAPRPGAPPSARRRQGHRPGVVRGVTPIGQAATGTVHAAEGGVYTVRLDDGRQVQASLRGRLKQGAGRVVIGDRVTVTPAGDAWTVEAVAERSSELARRGRGGREPKVLAANLDRVLAVLAL